MWHMFAMVPFTILLLMVQLVYLFPMQNIPPAPKHGFKRPDSSRSASLVRSRIARWSEEDIIHPWELSGLYEGDILLENEGVQTRNGILNVSSIWANGIIPFYIAENQFTLQELNTIAGAMAEIQKESCIRFRNYQANDSSWIVLRSNSSGCWSSVGRQENGQTVHLQSPNCVRHGIVVHELLHAVGFYHQQSTFDRDDYIQILWPNIKPGHEHNFLRYNETLVTSYNVPYDYGSIMHYSSKAFSKNNESTIVALQPNVTFGQRKRLSDGDITKLNQKYRAVSCETYHEQDTSTGSTSLLSFFIQNWFE